MAAVVVQVEHGDAVHYMAELAAMGPYRFQAARLTDTHKVYVLQSQPEFPRLIVLEPLTRDLRGQHDPVEHALPAGAEASRTPATSARSTRRSRPKAVREALEPQNIRFAYPGDTVSGFYTMEHLTFTFMSDFTYNRVGYVDVDLDDLDALGLGETFSLTADERDKLDRADALQAEHGIKGLVLGVDHVATRILAGDREHALLEYLTMVPYYFWGAYNIHEMNSSTNVTRHPDIGDDKKSPARVFTANNTPSIVNSFDNLPMPTEDFVRNFGRRMHHIAMAVIDGHVVDEKNVDYVVRQLADMGTPFLAHVVGECKDDPNLKQIFSKSSPYSLLITEYIERCHNYEGFFTRDNVAALTAAAGADERYEHGHVFD